MAAQTSKGRGRVVALEFKGKGKAGRRRREDEREGRAPGRRRSAARLIFLDLESGKGEEGRQSGVRLFVGVTGRQSSAG